jgi:hypothetical protein
MAGAFAYVRRIPRGESPQLVTVRLDFSQCELPVT